MYGELDKDDFCSLRYIVQCNHIRIYADYTMESLALLNKDVYIGDGTVNRNSMIFQGSHSPTPVEFYSLLAKVAELGINSLSLYSIGFIKFDIKQFIGLIKTGPLNKLTMTRITFELCSGLEYLLPIFIPCELDSHPTYFRSLTTINVSSYDHDNCVRNMLVNRMKTNYRLRYVSQSENMGPQMDHSESTNKIAEYLERNRRGYKKCRSAIITILGIRWHRISILSTIDKPVVVIICKMLAETIGTKIWTI